MRDRGHCSGPFAAPSPPLWEVYAELCGTRLFRARVAWQEHVLVVRYLARARSAGFAAEQLAQLVAHHLFGTARRLGRKNALADPQRALRLLARSSLPAAGVVQVQWPDLAALHLRGFEAGPQRMLRRWVLRRAQLLRRGFFEPRPDSRRATLWGERFVVAPGEDWFQQCLSTLSKAAVRAVCRGDFRALDDPCCTLAL